MKQVPKVEIKEKPSTLCLKEENNKKSWKEKRGKIRNAISRQKNDIDPYMTAQIKEKEMRHQLTERRNGKLNLITLLG
ncbi:hypothetical protein XENTR_v10001310 [Xenopus tropicalis]|nr:hypothetical protein XENTR_v10001310 [Xenopus tropicalis]